MNEASFIPKTPYEDSYWPSHGSIGFQAPSNIALVKYWGKHGLQLPMNASLSFTLGRCHTQTVLSFSKKEKGAVDFDIFLNGTKTPSFAPKIQVFFERIEPYVPFLKSFRFVIETHNSFPHSSGIASSASGMGALAMCLVAMEQRLQGSTTTKLSIEALQKASFLARLGSGSAARSIEGPLVVWGKHAAIEKSSDLYGTVYPYEVHPNFENYQDAILLVDTGVKQVSSTVGHGLMQGHPYADQRFRQANDHLGKLVPILRSGDLESFVAIVESEALSLHAMMLTSQPYFVLMQPNTLEIINRIWVYRRETGVQVCFTLDAGANVHVLYPENEKESVQKFIASELEPFCKEGKYILDHAGLGAQRLLP
ncbi:MAG: diphosphomevalonate decarboxylase [Flavobacteriaceae bacterium]